MADRPRLLDLFCGAGGAAMGYRQAGFHVTGVDIKPQPRYAGDVFIQGDALRDALLATGRPYVIENVVGAPLHTTIVLCGTMFGLRIYRHRLFESNMMLFQPAHPKHSEPTIQRGWKAEWSGFVTVTGGHNVPVATSRIAMGIDWMTRRELSQAIPPAYTRFIGAQLLSFLRLERAA